MKFNEQVDGPKTVPSSGNTVLATYDVVGHTRLSVEIAVATQALDAFIIEVRAHKDGSFRVIASSSTEYVNTTGLIVGSETYDASNVRLTGDLTILVSGGSGFLVIDVTSINAVRISASAAADSASVTTRARVG